MDQDAAPSPRSSAPEKSSSAAVGALTETLLLRRDEVSLDDDLVDVLEYLRHTWDEHGYDDPSLPSTLRCVGSALLEIPESPVIRRLALPYFLEALRIERRRVEVTVKAAEESSQECETKASGTVVSRLLVDLVVGLNAVGECLLDDALSAPAEAAAYLDEASEIRRGCLESALIASVSDGDAEDSDESERSPSAVALIFAVAAYNSGRAHFELSSPFAHDDDEREMAEARRCFNESAVLATRVAKFAAESVKVGHDDEDADAYDTRASSGERTADENEDAAVAEEIEASKRRLETCQAMLGNIGQYAAAMSCAPPEQRRGWK